MDDLIFRKAAIEYLMTNMGWHDEDGYAVDDADEKRGIITDLVNGIPAVDVAPVIHGHWTRIHIKGKEYGKVYYQHENCAPLLFESPYHYCPHCGAKIDEHGKDVYTNE